MGNQPLWKVVAPAGVRRLVSRHEKYVSASFPSARRRLGVRLAVVPSSATQEN